MRSCVFVLLSWSCVAVQAHLVHLVPTTAAPNHAIQFQASEEEASASPQWSSHLDAAVARGVLDFGLRLERATWSASTSDASVVLSPLSVAVALAVVLLGAAGDTKTQVATLLGGDDHPSLPLHLGRQLAQLLRAGDADGDVDVSLASAVFVQNDLPLNRRFVRLGQEAYRSAAHAVDFQRHGADAQDAINAWVSRETRGKILQLASEPPSPETRLVVASAIYFNGAWEKPFPKATTVRRAFHVDHDLQVEVSLMTNSADLPFYSDQQLGCSVLGLPYQGGRVVMYLVLPDRVGLQTLKELEANLTAAAFKRLVAATNVTSVIVAVPRMTLESTLSLKDPLVSMGVTALFDPATADLGGLLEDPANRTSSLYVDAVLHKVRVEVTETGTVAAAVTALSISRDGSRPVFRADHPFLFFIHDRDTGLVLFSGRVVKPTPFTALKS